ncbi:MAG: YheU family protein [Ectothiorhodospiraceae bacterium]|nr:YheU family protein [Ectothiorhodospiraceae bacterium]
MKIPFQQLSPDTLQAIIEEFITRSGTDYGEQEIPLPQMRQQVLDQLEQGTAVIVYDDETETCTILPSADVPDMD